MSNEMPEQPKTKELPAMTDRALLEDLTRSVKEGFARQDQRFSDVEENVSVLVGQGKSLSKWRGEVDAWREEVDGRLRSSSVRVKSESQTNETQDGVLAKHTTTLAEHGRILGEIQAAQAENRKATAETLASIQTDVKTFFARHPALAAALVLFVTAIAGAGTSLINARFNPPPPVVQQVAK